MANETVTDIDGNVYSTVRIGNQVWTVENSRTTKCNDGTALALGADSAAWSSYDGGKEPACCWYDDSIDNREKYGALYNWYAVNTGKLAPKGWHVPSDAEWTELEKYLVANGYNWDGSKEVNKLAKALSAQTGWAPSANAGAPGNNLATNNSSGFSALAGGSRGTDGRFYPLGDHGIWWSATESAESNAYRRSLGYSIEYLGRNNNLKGCGFFVRFVRHD